MMNKLKLLINLQYWQVMLICNNKSKIDNQNIENIDWLVMLTRNVEL